MRFKAQPLDLPGLTLVRATKHEDSRGFFMEWFRESEFARLGLPTAYVQDNHARSRRGVLRGLHFQAAPAEQAKLVRVASGTVFDVAVDLRPESDTFGRWRAVTLTGADSQMLYIPPGFAHGYLVLSDTADLTYKVTAEYVEELNFGIRWDDPDIGIDWPVDTPLLSERDRALPALREVNLPLGASGELG